MLRRARPALSGRLPELNPWFVDFANLVNAQRRDQLMSSELRDRNEEMAKSAPAGQVGGALDGDQAHFSGSFVGRQLKGTNTKSIPWR